MDINLSGLSYQIVNGDPAPSVDSSGLYVPDRNVGKLQAGYSEIVLNDMVFPTTPGTTVSIKYTSGVVDGFHASGLLMLFSDGRKARAGLMPSMTAQGFGLDVVESSITGVYPDSHSGMSQGGGDVTVDFSVNNGYIIVTVSTSSGQFQKAVGLATQSREWSLGFYNFKSGLRVTKISSNVLPAKGIAKDNLRNIYRFTANPGPDPADTVRSSAGPNNQGGSMSFLDDVFDWLGDLFTWLWDNLSLVLAICAILFIAFAPLMVAVIGPGTVFAAALPSYLSWIPAMVETAAASWWIAIPAGLGLAYVIDPDTASSLISGAANLVVDTATTIATGTVGAVSSAITGSSLFLYGVIGFVAYLILSRPKSPRPQDQHYGQPTDQLKEIKA